MTVAGTVDRVPARRRRRTEPDHHRDHRAGRHRDRAGQRAAGRRAHRRRAAACRRRGHRETTRPGDVETSGAFDPAADGLDFYESLEGMRAAGRQSRRSSGRRTTSARLPVVPAGPARRCGPRAAASSSARRDFNPERRDPRRRARASCTPVERRRPLHRRRSIGVARLRLRQLQAARRDGTGPSSAGGPAARDDRGRQRAGELAVATFNVENLDPSDPTGEVRRLAGQIVTNLAAPDLIALEEVQDNNGADRTTASSPPTRRYDAADRRDRRPPAARRTSSARSTRRRHGRRRAGRQHPRRLPVPHRPRAGASSTGPAATPTTPTAVSRAAAGRS